MEYVPRSRRLVEHFTYLHSFPLHNSLCQWYDYYSHFKDEETKAQRGYCAQTSKQVAKLGLDPRQCTFPLTTWFMPFTGVIGSFSEQTQVTPQVTAHLEEAAYRTAPLDMAV